MSRLLALAELAKIKASADALEAFFMCERPATPARARGLVEPALFFDRVRSRPPLGPTLSQGEVAGCERILTACAAAGFPLAWAAYALATAVHETAGAMAPVREYGKGVGKTYGEPGRNGGQVAYGRGDVQLTWDENYERADRELALNGALVADYDLALDPKISARILVAGMEGGWFTGKGLRLFLPQIARREQFVAARKIVNGTDNAELIAGYAETFQGALQAGGWR
ncbi:hypothetical protein [Phenylobacterium sp.]|jgi:hypothetical protein|uniref:hypothetical protein n=1 Tax=Phenylobacterium sp. TaxID=1871053 RepID=UPI0035AF1DC6